jgi:TPR repeat protein
MAALELGRRAWLDRRDLPAARRWIRRAAGLGEIDAGFYEAWLATKDRRTGALIDRDLEAGLEIALGRREEIDFSRGVPALRRAAQRKDPLAHGCYGFVLAELERPREARRWLLRAAREVAWVAHYVAEYCGFLRVPYREANRWLRRAAEGGAASAWNDWALVLREGPGSGVRRDLREAVKWYRRAAERGHPSAQLDLGFCLHEGMGVRRDDGESVRWYRRAAAQGQKQAMNNIVLCYRMGHGVRKSPAKAVEWLRRAASAGSIWASGELAGDFLTGDDGVRKSTKKALEWARRTLALVEETDGGGDQASDSMRNAVAEAQHALGVCASDGKGMRRDRRCGFEHLRLAAKGGHVCAAFDVAEAYEAGLGVARDPRAARRWFRHAARLGDPRAKKRLRSRSRSRR